MQLKIVITALVIMLAPAAGLGSDFTYVLDVTIDPSTKHLQGTAHISGGSGEELRLAVDRLINITVDGKQARPDSAGTIAVPAGNDRPTLVRYEANTVGHMDAQNIFLMSGWYPAPPGPARYTLSVTLPGNFKAVSEAESVSIAHAEDQVTYLFHFDHPRDGLHLAASSNYVVSKARHNDITIEAFFFEEDAALADTYIDYTRKYLEMYESILTPYPYRRFAIVENILPTGYSMPTFTLLGKQVVKLPFIVKTSLPHEIVHQWFGNHVYIDYGKGNWAEGLTTYLSDYLLEEKKGRGKEYRKRILVEYGAYVNESNAMPVIDFRYRGNKAESAVGYGRTAMFFHGLRRRLGDEAFFQALRRFIGNNRLQAASWDDIRGSFEEVSGETLADYFNAWLHRSDIPALVVQKGVVEINDGAPVLAFTLVQQGEPFPLKVPIQVHTETCVKTMTITMNQQQQDFNLSLESVPTKVVVDPEHDLMRHLTPAETPPVLAHIMGRDELIFVVAADQLPAYRPLMQALGNAKITTVTPEGLTFARMKESSLVICDRNNPMAAALFGGRTSEAGGGLNLEVFGHPYNENRHILIAHADSAQETLAVARKLRHYGKYSRLTFTGGKMLTKKTADSENGLVIHQQPPTLALRPGQAPTIGKILDGLDENRVVFVGEKHDSYAHHMNQLEIVRHLFYTGADVAVGMEMFHQPFQDAVDSYLKGNMDERTFLRESNYYQEWGFDYGLYKPIVDFLKENSIPLIALNIPGGVSKQVARKGLESLDDQQQKWVPADLDFSGQTYRRDLKQVFDLHGGQTGIDEFDYFLQAQVLWDEGMAERAFRFLEEHPRHTLVVLAGNGHIRYGYGIPQRLFRRLGAPYTTIVQDEPLDTGVADHVLLTSILKGKSAPKLGVMVEENEKGLTIKSIGKNSPAEEAGLQKGDFIKAFDGRPIENLADLRLTLFYCHKDQTTAIQVQREDKTLTQEITLFELSPFSMHGKK